MEKMKMQTKDIADENFRKLAALFPDAVTETINADGEVVRAIDKDKLLQNISTTVVEGNEERYQFTWPDKRKAIRLAASPIAATLRPCLKESAGKSGTPGKFDSENLYIEGDNLDVLKLLRETYLGKVKMIYIDPPYNTGNDFVYEDDFSESADDYAERSGDYDDQGNRMVQNTDSNGRFHTDWLNMIYPRLKLAKDLLSDDGVIFISIDDNEVGNLKKVCDEVFGESNFVAIITLLCNPKGRSQDKYIANCHEYILVYSRSVLIANSVSIPKSKAEIESDYLLKDSDGAVYRELELRNTHRDFGKFNRPKLWYPIYVTSDNKISLDKVSNSTPVYPIWEDGFEGCWTWGVEKAQKEISLLVAKATAGKLKIYRKAYAFNGDLPPMKQVKSIWTEKEFFTEKGQAAFSSIFESKEKLFQSPKSVATLFRCIQMGSAKDSIVLDFFSGSATTAHAVMKLNAKDGGNRKFIMVQLPEHCDEKSEAAKAGYKNICEIGKERIRRAGKKILEEHSSVAEKKDSLFSQSAESAKSADKLDVGFRVLKLDSTNMEAVYYNPSDTKQDDLLSRISNIKFDRTPEDLLFQVMLELGILPSSKIEKSTIAGKQVFNVADNFLIACFDENITDEVVTAIAKQKPQYVVLRNSGFSRDSVAANFEQILATYSPDTTRRIL